MNDQELITAWKNGDSALYLEMEGRFRPRLKRFLLARNLCSDANVEDRVQTTFLLAIQKIETLRDPAFFLPWLYQIGRRVCWAETEKNRSITFVSFEDEETEAAGMSGRAAFAKEKEVYQKEERRYHLWETAHEILTEEEFRILWLRYAENRSSAEIAPIIHKRAGAIRALLFRIRKNWPRPFRGSRNHDKRFDKTKPHRQLVFRDRVRIFTWSPVSPRANRPFP